MSFPNLGAPGEFCSAKLGELGGSWPKLQDILVTVDSNDSVPAEGCQALVEEKQEHGMVPVGLERNSDIRVHFECFALPGKEVGHQLVDLPVIIDDGSQVAPLP